jgi:hypothetical protein
MPGENYILLERTELNASAASVTFANIPQTGYTDLKIVVSGRTSGTDSPVKIEFNGVTTGYSWRRIYGNGSAASSLSGTDAYSLHVDTSSMTANTFSNSEIYIPNYTSSNQKSFSVETALETNATGGELFMLACLSTTTAAITSITLTHLNTNMIANSTFSLYGIAALGTTPVIAPKADGGNRIDNDGTYWYHTFTSSGSFVPQTLLTADCLVVAGGGGASSGGGGAGGYRTATGLSLTTTPFAVTVGAGGSGADWVSGTPTVGNNSVFSTITSSGGGYSGNVNGGNGGASAGGSGGGGGGSGSAGSQPGGAGNTPSTSPSQGNNGGIGGFTGNNQGAAGGGGAGAVGSNTAGASIGGAGGAGSNSASSYASATSTGVSGFYAGGGGGGGNSGAGAGGSGGGGSGGTGGTGNAGTANTGGGGGGAVGTGASGGSGIVIIRYPIAS